jgi:hypothetical protein
MFGVFRSKPAQPDPIEVEAATILRDAGRDDLLEQLGSYVSTLTTPYNDAVQQVNDTLDSKLADIEKQFQRDYYSLNESAPDWAEKEKAVLAKEQQDIALARAQAQSQIDALRAKQAEIRSNYVNPDYARQVVSNPSLLEFTPEMNRLAAIQEKKIADDIRRSAQITEQMYANNPNLLRPAGLSEPPAPLPVETAPEPTIEYLLGKSTVPRSAAEAEAARIASQYNVNPDDMGYLADLAQLYGISNAEQQYKGTLAKQGVDLNQYAIDTTTPSGQLISQRLASDRQALSGIGAFQPTMPQFTFGQPPVQPSGLPQQVSPGLPGLLVPAQAPVLSPGLAAIGAARTAPQPLLVPTEAPVLGPRTAYIGVPAATQAAPAGMKEGGLASVAREVAAEGRRGDSMLVHMTPDEVAGLQALARQMGGSLTVNPDTGLPEANFFKKILPFVAAFAAPYLAPVVGGSALAGAALAGGLAAGGTMLGGGSFNEGIKTGLTAFGAAGLSSGAMGTNPLGVGGESTFNLGNVFGGAPAQTQVGPGAGAVDVTGGGVTADELLASGRGELLASPAPTLPAPPPTVKPESTILGMSPSTAITAGVVGTGLFAGEQERQAFERMEEERKAEEERRRGLGLREFNRSLGVVPAASGGLVALAGGGMTYMEAGGTTGPTGVPRDVTGTGDGMSDSVPATIEGVQEARLADGEFVIPADVVADIGNGSSDAGSKKLYDMMDRIRKARHGTTEQPPEINAEALIPA